MPRIEMERLDHVEDAAESSAESFDRVAFAERALELVRAPGVTVAICEGARRVGLSQGRQWGGAPGERWAILYLCPNASRNAIASAVLGLARAPHSRHGAPSAHVPWTLDILSMQMDDAS
jgi:hypothetical protein